MLKIDGFSSKFGNTASPVEKKIPETSSATAAVVREEEKIKPPSSFKLKKAFAETAQHYDVSRPQIVSEISEVKVEACDPFDAEKVRQALETYIGLYKPETTVSVALTTHAPFIHEGDIVLEVDNPLQLEKVKAVQSHLQNALAKQLNNGTVSLSVRIFDDTEGKQEERRLITSQDKLEHFIKENPVVGEMAKIFGLEFE